MYSEPFSVNISDRHMYDLGKQNTCREEAHVFNIGSTSFAFCGCPCCTYAWEKHIHRLSDGN